MTYKIMEETKFGSIPVHGIFNSKATAAAFIIKYLPWTTSHFWIKEVEKEVGTDEGEAV